jgi:predicted secreted Zn-dependent protease
MVRSTILVLIISAMISMFAYSTPVIGKTTSTDVSEKAHDTWETFKAYVVDQKHIAVEHGKELLKKADVKIEEMESKAAKTSGDTKAEYQESIKKLKKMQANASKKLDELEKSSASSWDTAKDGFAEAYKDLNDAYKEANKKFE